MSKKDPIRPSDQDARDLARNLLAEATFGALAVIDPSTRAPSVTRVAIGTATDGTPVTLISRLATHFPALEADSRCSLLIGEPADKGDPLAHPRMTLTCEASFLNKTDAGHKALRDHYLANHPKSKLYIDFPDFFFVQFTVQGGLLNGGFGKAFRLTSSDLVVALKS